MSARYRAVLVNKETALQRAQRRSSPNAGDSHTAQNHTNKKNDKRGDGTDSSFSNNYWRRLRASHKRHQTDLGLCVGVLERLNWEARVVEHANFSGTDGEDLVISVGGDGTALHASHYTIGVPLLGVNSDPGRSTGYFCGTDAAGLRDTLERFMNDDLNRFELQRLRLEMNGVTVGPPALNDVLFANTNPAATSSYILAAGSREERQKSSGVWISAPAGSTAGIRSAGGVVLPLEAAQLEYLVREPVSLKKSQRYELLRGVRNLDEGLTVVSLMDDGCAYVDGPLVRIPMPVGCALRLSAHEPLTLLGLELSRRER